MTDTGAVLPDCGRQEGLDRFYWTAGRPCCAGCDWWRHLNSVAGECTRSAPVSAAERLGLVGITNATLPADAGHVITPRDHACGDFRDSFDWASLPPAYRRRIGWAYVGPVQEPGAGEIDG